MVDISEIDDGDGARYCIVGIRPVKGVRTPEGGLDIQVFDWTTGAFVRDIDYLDAVVAPGDRDVDFVDRDEFYRQVAALRAERGFA